MSWNDIRLQDSITMAAKNSKLSLHFFAFVECSKKYTILIKWNINYQKPTLFSLKVIKTRII